MNMKSLVLLLFVVLCYLSPKSQTIADNTITIDFDHIATSRCSDRNENYLKYKHITYANIYGIIRLTNQGDSTISFWIMNCSWTDLIKIEPDSILLAVLNCDSNYPRMISLNQGQSIVFNSVIEIPSNYFEQSLKKARKEKSYNTFRIGFIYINGNEYEGIGWDLWDKIKEEKQKLDKLIWTKPINIEYSQYRREITN